MGEKDKEILADLTMFVNQHCMENDCDTPDFIIAEMMYGVYKQYCEAIKKRDRWFGFEPWNHIVGEQKGGQE